MDIRQEELHDLIARAMAGDEVAFEELYKMNSKSILFNARNLIYNVNDVEDVAQEIVLQMHRSIGALKSPYAFSAWMHRITLNICHTYNSRKAGKWAENSLSEAEYDAPDPDVSVSPERSAELAARNDSVLSAITMLPEKQRISLVMHYYDEMTFVEIGRALGVSEKTASANVTRAKKNMKNLLGNEYWAREGADSDGGAEASFIACSLGVGADLGFSAVDVDKFWRGCDALIARDGAFRPEQGSSSRQANAGKSASGGAGFAAAVSLALVLAVLVSGVILFLNPPLVSEAPAVSSAPAVFSGLAAPEAEIVFENEGDEPDDVNPFFATVEASEALYTAVSWRVLAGFYDGAAAANAVDGGEGGPSEAVAYGYGDFITDLFETLPSGEYHLAWELASEDGSAVMVYRDFTIV